MSSLLHRQLVRLGVAQALAVGSLAVSTAMAAEPAGLKLAWRDSTGECSREAMTSLYDEHLRSATRETRTVHATVELSQSGRGLDIRLTARVGGHVGRREFVARDCQEAEAAIALLLALVAESRSLPADSPSPTAEQVPKQPPASPETGIEPPRAREPTPPPSPQPVLPPPTPAPIHWNVELYSLATFGVVPTPGFGFGAGVGGRWTSFQLSLRAAAQTGSITRRTQLPLATAEQSEITTTVQRAELSMQLCAFLPGKDPTDLGLCVHSGIHQNRARFATEGAGESTSAAHWHGGASARGMFHWSHFFLSVEPFVGIETVQPVRGVCPIGSTPSSVCDTDQFTGDSVNFGLKAGVGTQF